MKISVICDVFSGGTPKTNNPLYWEGDIPWVSIKDILSVNRYIETTEKFISEQGLENCAATLLSENDIILSARGTVGKSALVSKPMTLNQSCYALRSKSKDLNQIYLFYWLRTNTQIFSACKQGAVFDNITRDFFDQCEISYPNFDVQLRITNTTRSFQYAI